MAFVGETVRGLVCALDRLCEVVRLARYRIDARIYADLERVASHANVAALPAVSAGH
jgi:hypothetical protein